VAYSMRTRVLS